MYTQTSRGAVAFVRMISGPGGAAPSQVNLRDGITIQPDAGGGYNVRTMDVPPLQAAGLVIGDVTASATPTTTGASSLAQFQAGVLSGQGAGTAT